MVDAIRFLRFAWRTCYIALPVLAFTAAMSPSRLYALPPCLTYCCMVTLADAGR
jgi:hypothetical protein